MTWCYWTLVGVPCFLWLAYQLDFLWCPCGPTQPDVVCVRCGLRLTRAEYVTKKHMEGWQSGDHVHFWFDQTDYVGIGIAAERKL